MTVGSWREDLSSLPPVGKTINRGGYSVPADVELPGGYVDVTVPLSIRATIRPALFGVDVTPEELRGDPYQFVRFTSPFNYYKNNPLSSPVWNGSVQLPTLPVDGPATLVLNSPNFGGEIGTAYGLYFEAPNFPAADSVEAIAVGIRFHLRDLVTSVYTALGPSAGYPEPVVPQGYRIEWEYPEAEFLGVQGAACTASSISPFDLRDRVEWYTPGSTSVFRPIAYDEHVVADDPLSPLPPYPAAWGTFWAAGTRAIGPSISIAANQEASGPFGLMPGTDVGDPALLPLYYTAIGAPPVLRGDLEPPPIGSSGLRGSQWLAIKPVFRARRYRFVGLSGVRQYPRDDGAGLSSPRVASTPSHRVVGGYE